LKQLTLPNNDARYYDADYFQTRCGQPYHRTPEWLRFFAGIAQSIVTEIGPKTVLDAGCAWGFLVEGLRDVGVEAYGVDLSDFAISRVRSDLSPFCWVGSLTEPLPRRYDLIVCIEVLEHMTAADGEKSIANLCATTDDILLSSTPFDYQEATHFNVQPIEYWAERFAVHGFVRDVDFDASFITPWAIRFRRTIDPWHRVIRDYERRYWTLWKENLDLRSAALAHRRPGTAPAATTAAKPATFVPAITPRLKDPQPANPEGHVLVISHDIVGQTMAGAGIRYYQLARVLASEQRVILAMPSGSSLSAALQFELLTYDSGQSPELEAAIKGARTVVVSGAAVCLFPLLAKAGVPVAVDIHNPVQAENLFYSDSKARDLAVMLTTALVVGDFFFCASERQRDWWLGLLDANGRINAANHREDPTLRRLIDLVPTGLPSDPPQHTHQVVKGVWPGIGTDAQVLLWGGGLWPWLDPLTAVRAMPPIAAQRPNVRLLFPGTRHPSSEIANQPNLAQAARDLAKRLGLLDKTVFFGNWVPYENWPNFLLESDVALTLHPRDTLEARLAFRTRVLDYLWAGLPTVASSGDVLADLIAERQLGVVVEPENPAAVAQAVLRLLDVPRSASESNFNAVRQALAWETVVRPLLEFCRHPRLAPDKSAGGAHLGNAYYADRIAQLEQALNWYKGHRALKLFHRLDPLVLRFPWLRRWVRP
jgi:glycosyltransferase involved in cell wall biosynthesis